VLPHLVKIQEIQNLKKLVKLVKMKSSKEKVQINCKTPKVTKQVQNQEKKRLIKYQLEVVRKVRLVQQMQNVTTN